MVEVRQCRVNKGTIIVLNSIIESSFQQLHKFASGNFDKRTSQNVKSLTHKFAWLSESINKHNSRTLHQLLPGLIEYNLCVAVKSRHVLYRHPLCIFVLDWKDLYPQLNMARAEVLQTDSIYSSTNVPVIFLRYILYLIYIVVLFILYVYSYVVRYIRVHAFIHHTQCFTEIIYT